MEPERVYLLYGERPGDLYFIPEGDFDERFKVEKDVASFKVTFEEDQIGHSRMWSYMNYHTLDEARSDINTWTPCSLHVIRIYPFTDK